MMYYNGKTKTYDLPCHLHTDALGTPLPCNMDECKEDCNYKEWRQNDIPDKCVDCPIADTNRCKCGCPYKEAGQ